MWLLKKFQSPTDEILIQNDATNNFTNAKLILNDFTNVKLI